MTEPGEVQKSFDRFELLVALLLGFSAIGAAFSGFQNALWGGKQSEGYSEANMLNTRATKEYNEQNSTVNSDYAAIAQAKKLILEAIDAKSETDRVRCCQMASYFYTDQISPEAYKALSLPADIQEKENQPASRNNSPRLRNKAVPDIPDGLVPFRGNREPANPDSAVIFLPRPFAIVRQTWNDDTLP